MREEKIMSSAYQSQFLQEQELRNLLEKAFNYLQEQGFLKGEDRNDLIDKVIENIKDGHQNIPEINKSDAGKSLTNALRVMLIDEHLNGMAEKEGQEGTQRLNYAKLLKNLPDLSNEEKDKLKEELKEYFEEKLSKINALSPKPKPDSVIKKMSEDLAEGLVENRSENLVNDQRVMGFFAALAMLSDKELTYRSLNAGMSQGETGGEQSIITELPSNALGFIDMTQNLATDMSSMAERGRFDTKEDPMGMEFSLLIEEIGSGAVIDTAAEEEFVDPLEQQLGSQAPRNVPPGSG